jgi:hypothetical protein
MAIMIIHLNGLPGVGKLTIARILVARLGGRLLDSHTVYNVAFSLTEFRTPEFYDLVRSVRDVAYSRVATTSVDVPVILTNALGTGPWADENWKAVVNLAQGRGSKLYAVAIICSRDQHLLRVASSERSYLRKLTDPTSLRFDAGELSTVGADAVLQIDSSSRSPEECADQIFQWVQGR